MMLLNKLGISYPFSAAPNMNYSEEISLFANASDRFSADTIQRHAVAETQRHTTKHQRLFRRVARCRAGLIK
jgi:hypothetical protein